MNYKNVALLKLSLIVLFLAAAFFPNAAAAQENKETKSSDNIWQTVQESNLSGSALNSVKPERYRLLQLNKRLFTEKLTRAPLEVAGEARKNSLILSLPNPSGNFDNFYIDESPILSNELAIRFPDIKTYSGQGIDDATATARFTWTLKGLNAFVISEKGSYMISPFSEDSTNKYMSYFTYDTKENPFSCLMSGGASREGQLFGEHAFTAPAAVNLRTYRLAVSTTREFIFGYGGGTPQGTIDAVIVYVSNLNAIYQRELAIRFNLVAVYGDPNGTVFNNGNLQQMNAANPGFLDFYVGRSNYEVGHVMGYSSQTPTGLASFGSGGVNGVGAACELAYKEQSSTLVAGPVGNYWSSMVIAHELGHMFGARHTFTPITSNNCLQQADPAGLVEPGSGSTLMSYAGVCGTDNLRTNEVFNTGNSFFHIHSLIRINRHRTTSFPSCGVSSATTNSAPIITNGGTSVRIPRNTPFMLTAAANDPDGHTVTYSWEQIDTGGALFRSFPPTTNPSRIFPSLAYILNNANNPPLFVDGFFSGETLPDSTRILNFFVTARDNFSGGGGISTQPQSLQIEVRGEAGPFFITQPNTAVSFNGGSQQTIAWNVANTNLAPISATSVKISLSTDGGNSFPIVLANNTANDGSETVTLPNIQTSTARIKIEAAGNIFFDISNVNFNISQATNIQVTVQTNPAGRSFTVDGLSYTSPQVFNWQSGSSHTIATTSPQGNNSTRYNWSNWSDGGAISHIIAPTSNITYTANFTTQHFLTMNAGSGGTVSPATGWYNAGQSVQISAAPNNGFNFSGWTGTGSGSYTGSNNPATVTMNNPVNQTANFSSIPACTYTISPPNRTFNSSGGTGIFTVTAPNGCAWTVTATSSLIDELIGNYESNFSMFGLTSASWLTITSAGSGSGNGTVNYSVPQYIGQFRTGTITLSANGQTRAVHTVNQSARSSFDFDGDGKTDISIFRPALGQWWYLRSSDGSNRAFQFGSSSDKLVPADYTGDGKTDIAFFRPSTNQWFILRSEDNSFYSFPFGASGDVPAPADYDGDGKADAAVFRPSTTTWFINRSSGGTTIQQFGASGDVPAVADYDGDGKSDIAIYRPSLGQWWLSRSSLGVIAFQFGASTDKPVQGDYTGDGKADVAFFRRPTGEWFILRSENSSFYAFPFGTNGDIASPGDYDGDGKFDAAVFRPSGLTWYVNRSSSTVLIAAFGVTGDVPVPSAFVP
jgi:hypothetical protein